MSVCAATRRDGQPCTTPALEGEDCCFAHSARLAARRREAAARGGRNRSTSARSSKHLPEHLRSVQDMLLALLDEVHAGEVQARSAEVIGGLAGRLLEFSKYADERGSNKLLEERITELEQRLGEGVQQQWR